MLDVVAFGELLIDFTCKSIDSDGYPTMEAHPGGAPANFLAALSSLGAKTALIGKVGDDAFGRSLINTLENLGICTSGLIMDNNVFTTMAFVTLDASGNREFSFARKPGADTQICINEVNYNLIDEAKVFHFGTLSLTTEPARSATVHAVLYAKSKGKLITYDPNLRKPLWGDLDQAKRHMLWGLQQADVVKISDEEVNFLFGLGVEDGARYILRNYAPKLIFVTCGAEGCYFINRNASGWVQSLNNINVIDTTGAGDIFGGSAVWMLLQNGKAPENLHEAELRHVASFACTSASLSTTRFGGISSVPVYNEILANIKE
ncbi:MAG: carbohydrate kinase [Oscillospiraceae bacterium]|nr:carbohydrate kinase [Oscillospiraceae bacterium]